MSVGKPKGGWHRSGHTKHDWNANNTIGSTTSCRLCGLKRRTEKRGAKGHTYYYRKGKWCDIPVPTCMGAPKPTPKPLEKKPEQDYVDYRTIREWIDSNLGNGLVMKSRALKLVNSDGFERSFKSTEKAAEFLRSKVDP